MTGNSQLSIPFDKGSPNLKLNSNPLPIESWKKRAIDCLMANQTLMTTIEMLTCTLGAKEFSVLDKDQRLNAVTNLSVTMSNLCRDGYVKKLKILGLKGNYYGLSNWFEKDGRIIKDYADDTLSVFLENVYREPKSCCD
jgi:hypothetical protein